MEHELERFARIAEANVVEGGGVGAILILLDSDNDCAVEVARDFHARIARILPLRPVGVALAVREFESWLVAGAADGPDAPDEHRPTKRWLQESAGSYRESIDQPRLTARLDIGRAKANSRSFRHFVEVVERLREDCLRSR